MSRRVLKGISFDVACLEKSAIRRIVGPSGFMVQADLMKLVQRLYSSR